MGAEGAGGAPLTPANFSRLMDVLGPFETAPRIAVALSGGPDSMALSLLLAGWVRDRGGDLLALTVDHGLRHGSDAEAARVAGWMRDRGITHEVLRWEGQKPATGVHAAAREVRYALLAAACRRHGILHLALGHQQQDQEETVALRGAEGSGPDGLAGMPTIRELPDLRLIRPLLAVPRARLAATCAALDQPVIHDPSNLDPRFARARLRLGGGLVTPATGAVGGWLATGRARAAAEAGLAETLARHAAFHPEGWVELAVEALAGLPPEMGMRLLSHLLGAVGGQPYPPRRERLLRLWQSLEPGVPTFRGASLGGCLLIRAVDVVRIVREARTLAPPVVVEPCGTALWDRRFRLRWGGDRSVRMGALGGFTWVPPQGSPAERAARRLPAAVRRTLPAIAEGGRIMLVPHLSHVDPSADGIGWTLSPELPVPAAGPSFSVVLPDEAII